MSCTVFFAAASWGKNIFHRLISDPQSADSILHEFEDDSVLIKVHVDKRADKGVFFSFFFDGFLSLRKPIFFLFLFHLYALSFLCHFVARSVRHLDL